MKTRSRTPSCPSRCAHGLPGCPRGAKKVPQGAREVVKWRHQASQMTAFGNCMAQKEAGGRGRKIVLEKYIRITK